MPAHLKLRVREGFLPVTLLIALTVLLVLSGFLWRWDQLTYDLELRMMTQPPPDDILIVAIDEASLRELGRWPWPRRVQSELINKISDAGARVIGLDVVFAEPDTLDPEGDRILARAVARAGNVILPVLKEHDRLGGQLTETLPLPGLVSAAAGLGHVDMELDLDGVARSVYLLAGLGTPRWPHFSLAIQRFLEPDSLSNLPGTRIPELPPLGSLVWVRDHQVRIPYLGSPGHFPRISAADLLSGQYDPSSIRDRIVLVGATATGLGDVLPSPVSGHSIPMPGVEITANILTALRNGSVITTVPRVAQALVSAMLVVLPLLFFVGHSPRTALVIATVSLVLVAAITFALLKYVHLWFPPMPLLLGIALSYPLWSLRRLENTIRLLNRQLARLQSEPVIFERSRARDSNRATEFVTGFVPLDGWSLFDDKKRPVAGWGCEIRAPAGLVSTNAWVRYGPDYWSNIRRSDRQWLLGIRWRAGRAPNARESRMIQELVEISLPDEIMQTPGGSAELVEQRVQQVQSAVDQLGYMRRFISGGLAQMADGFLVADHVGQILLSNPRTGELLCDRAQHNLVGSLLFEVFQDIDLESSETWKTVFRAVLLEGQDLQISGQSGSGRELLFQFGPMRLEDVGVDGLICNVSDTSDLRASERQRSELLSFISHDLRSPLVSILALTEMARESDEKGEVRSDVSGRIDRYARQTLKLAEDLVQLAKAENIDEVALHEVEIVSIVQNAVEQVWSQAQAKQIKLETVLEIDLAWIRGDEGLLERAFVNLVNNAVKYSPSESKVVVSAECRSGEFVMCVADQGIGISSENVPKLFGRFTRFASEQGNSESGAGLGLVFVKTVIERHGGTLSVSSEEGAGSRFCVSLPSIDEPL